MQQCMELTVTNRPRASTDGWLKEVRKKEDGKYFQCAVLKAYGANTQVLAFCHLGESYNGSIAVSKTVHGGSNPSSPVKY